MERPPRLQGAPRSVRRPHSSPRKAVLEMDPMQAKLLAVCQAYPRTTTLPSPQNQVRRLPARSCILCGYQALAAKKHGISALRQYVLAVSSLRGVSVSEHVYRCRASICACAMFLKPVYAGRKAAYVHAMSRGCRLLQQRERPCFRKFKLAQFSRLDREQRVRQTF